MSDTTTTDPKPVDIDTTSSVAVSEDVFLHVEADVPLSDSVTVEFHVQPEGLGSGVTWKEDLKAETAKAKDAKKKASRIKWKVALAKPGDKPKIDPPAAITFEVKDAKGVTAIGDEKLFVRRIKVTEKKDL